MEENMMRTKYGKIFISAGQSVLAPEPGPRTTGAKLQN
jgi:hypothetical protein